MPTYLLFNDDEAIQYAEFTTGEIEINAVVPVDPVAGQSKKWGVYSLAREAGLYFEITGTTFRAVATSKDDGQNTVSDTENITWNSNWTGVEVLFKIRWEAGMAKFFINGVKVATIAFSDTSGLVLASTPLSLYVDNANADNLLIGYIEVKNAGNYITNR